MSVILNLIGWPLGLLCAAVAAWCVIRLAWTPKHPKTGKRMVNAGDGGYWFTGLMFGTAAVADFTALGVISVVAGAVITGVMFTALVLLAKPWQQKGRGALNAVRSSAVDGIRESGRDAQGAWSWIAAHAGGLSCGGGEAEQGPVPLEAVAGYAATRAIPSVMADPALGPATEPGEIAAAGIPVPAPYAALAEFIGGFEPEDDMSLRMFMEGHASGTVTIADAWHHFADTCLNGVGLSPAYVAGILEAGDSAGEHASLLAQVHKRFHVVYAAIKEWIGAHGPLPHKAREFLTGEE